MPSALEHASKSSHNELPADLPCSVGQSSKQKAKINEYQTSQISIATVNFFLHSWADTVGVFDFLAQAYPTEVK